MCYALDVNQSSKPSENCSAATVANKKTDGIRKIKIKARCTHFYFVFRSVCTIFADEQI